MILFRIRGHSRDGEEGGGRRRRRRRRLSEDGGDGDNGFNTEQRSKR